MKKQLSGFFLVLATLCLFAQNKTFVYQLDYRYSDKKDDKKKETFTLDIVNQQSVFRTEDEKKSDSLLANGKYGYGTNLNLENQIYVIKDGDKNEISKFYRTLLKTYYDVKITEKLDWKILPDKDKIGDFEVQKAEVNYGGRNWTAWFTAEISIPEGPYIFNGLPGLIVKVKDSRDDYDFTLKAVKKNTGDLYLKKRGLRIDYPTFKKIMMNHYNDPYTEARMANVPIAKDDGNGNPVRTTFTEMTPSVQKHIRDTNNPIELNYKNDYK
ncbi:GLPGLI family protein [Elizabethkingia anophelis]|uniref:GLPGLI family protein n=1 Tax=Elizabethkingia anophelis TaxID=1117645 RepID=UPI00136E10B5|nr:GLPGLI family protein [Elizabethkingia anophelis]MCT3899601.1 GLPGLI family protein [Elizabethkingia anophelis]MCT4122975.1 GLPGLI family protein [Elizabethkingia anophelis]MCT4327449.1 GLPGLI family protein [Elizabethkingia anophelis]MYY43383.1 GLPGLI family protein [Elizabethkingia anophelis]